MPVEIKELVIRVSVEESQQTTGNPNNPAYPYKPEPAWRREQLLKAALEQTVEVLRQKKER